MKQLNFALLVSTVLFSACGGGSSGGNEPAETADPLIKQVLIETYSNNDVTPNSIITLNFNTSGNVLSQMITMPTARLMKFIPTLTMAMENY